MYSFSFISILSVNLGRAHEWNDGFRSRTVRFHLSYRQRPKRRKGGAILSDENPLRKARRSRTGVIFRLMYDNTAFINSPERIIIRGILSFVRLPCLSYSLTRRYRISVWKEVRGDFC
jgi:hypothetical protein